MSEVIPEAAVEAAALAVYGDGYRDWVDENPRTRSRYLNEARAALEAAAPHMLAGAWDAGHTAGDGDCSVMWDADKAGKSVKYKDVVTRNPYGPTP